MQNSKGTAQGGEIGYNGDALDGIEQVTGSIVELYPSGNLYSVSDPNFPLDRRVNSLMDAGCSFPS